MSTAQAAARAYSSNQTHTKSNRDLEYDVMLGVTRDLKQLSGGSPMPFPLRVNVLHRNEKLWTEIGVQVAGNDNELPAELRAKLFYMSRYVTQQTSKLLQDTGSVDSLIEMNVAVLRGLKGGK